MKYCQHNTSVLLLVIAIAFWDMSSSVYAQVTDEASGQDVTGQVFVADTYKDWQKLCRTTNAGNDICHMYQLVKDENGHPTAEFQLFRIVGEEGIAAAATVMTPLGTLLPVGLKYSVDDGQVVTYPFSWCDKRGCYVRIAFTDDDVYSMKTGRSGIISIETITAPGSPIPLSVSFSGFTAAFGSLEH